MEKRYDKEGHLTLEGMRAVLEEGGAVMYRGVTITDPAQLPTKSQLAAASGKAEDKAMATADLKAQMAQMQAQIDALTQAPAPDMGGDLSPATGTTVPDDQKPAESVTGEPGVLPGGNGLTAPKNDTLEGDTPPQTAPQAPQTGTPPADAAPARTTAHSAAAPHTGAHKRP